MKVREKEFESLQEAINDFSSILPDPNTCFSTFINKEFYLHEVKVNLRATRIEENTGNNYWDVWL